MGSFSQWGKESLVSHRGLKTHKDHPNVLLQESQKAGQGPEPAKSSGTATLSHVGFKIKIVRWKGSVCVLPGRGDQKGRKGSRGTGCGERLEHEQLSWDEGNSRPCTVCQKLSSKGLASPKLLFLCP